MVIKRYLNAERFEKAKKDITPLAGLVNRSYGEYSLQLREDNFNIYYQGNSMAKVTLHSNNTYSAAIHKKFLEGNIGEKLSIYSKKTNRKDEYEYFRINPGEFNQFFQSNHLSRIAANIRKVDNGEEITFEQVLITDNPPTKNFIIIDRQVAAHGYKAQMDLLAVVRDSEDKPFHFLIIELKLGKNPELCGKVAEQLNEYIDHLKTNVNDYINCYKENYRQKKQLGLFDPSLPLEIDIDNRNVSGLIVVGGYSQLAQKAFPSLNKMIKEKQWAIKVQQLRNEIKRDNT